MNLKKFFATVLAVAAVFTALVVPASAASYGPPPKEFQHIGTEKVVKTYLGGFLKVTVIVGDVDGDGRVTQLDSTYILRYILNRDANPNSTFKIGKTVYFPGDFMYMMDCNWDGKITQYDATLILRYIIWTDKNR